MIPGIAFLTLILAFFVLPLWAWHRRAVAFRALSEKFALRDARFDKYTPDPQISGYFFSASYPRFLMGTLEGVAVVAFDYAIGWGRSQRLGAGVGVALPVDLALLQPMLPNALDVSQHAGWTFVYTTPLPFARIGYGLDPTEMEGLWRKMLKAPSFLRAEPLRVTPAATPVPGELHIRPRHPTPHT